MCHCKKEDWGWKETRFLRGYHCQNYWAFWNTPVLIYGSLLSAPYIFMTLISHFPDVYTCFNHIMVLIWLPFVTNTSISYGRSLKIPHHLLGSFPGIWNFKDWFVEIPMPLGKNCVQMSQPNFLFTILQTFICILLSWSEMKGKEKKTLILKIWNQNNKIHTCSLVK